LAELEKAIAQKKKDDAKMCVTEQATRRRNEKATAEVRVVHKAAQEVVEQKKAAEATIATQTA